MSEKNYGILAEFDSPAAILCAAEKVRDAGYSPLGRVHAVPDSWHGQGDGLEKFPASAGFRSVLGGGAFMSRSSA